MKTIKLLFIGTTLSLTLAFFVNNKKIADTVQMSNSTSTIQKPTDALKKGSLLTDLKANDKFPTPAMVLKSSASSEVNTACSNLAFAASGLSVNDFLNNLASTPRAELNRCADSLTKNNFKVNADKCLIAIEKSKQTNSRSEAIKNCGWFVNLKFLEKYQDILSKKPIKSMTNIELVEAYHGLLADPSVEASVKMKTATKFAAELVTRTPDDLQAINMLIRYSMIDNENGTGYKETLQWIGRAAKLDPANENIMNHLVQRLSAGDETTIKMIDEFTVLMPSLLAGQIISTENHFRTDSEKIEQYKKLSQQFPENKNKYLEIISSIKNKKPNYFLDVVDMSLDTVPNYL